MIGRRDRLKSERAVPVRRAFLQLAADTNILSMYVSLLLKSVLKASRRQQGVEFCTTVPASMGGTLPPPISSFDFHLGDQQCTAPAAAIVDLEVGSMHASTALLLQGRIHVGCYHCTGVANCVFVPPCIEPAFAIGLRVRGVSLLCRRPSLGPCTNRGLLGIRTGCLSGCGTAS